ncbi:hypothetical protein HPP92_015224 [Vanilla planifolia]|uniref:ASCH domain-containing protein n=1 Tax=Vanilla planifolia TaxID=51239 RepID=A0A835QT55_VANPL|nr:hypothetical protein HPP92_015224 [Vanilla planifolia]
MSGRGSGPGAVFRGSSLGSGEGRGNGSSGVMDRGSVKYRNPCLTMHQPWASLLVYGIKRIEGRSWPSPVTGCVEVVGCLKGEELVNWEAVPESVRLEGLTDFCWLCENPEKLVIPFEMRGYQGVYNLEKKIYEAAVRGLTAVSGPLPVKFPFPDPLNPLSLKPGSLLFRSSNLSQVEKSKSVHAAIAGARAAATQFSKKDESLNAIKDKGYAEYHLRKGKDQE